MNQSIRKPAIAGTFYPAQAQALRTELEHSFTHAIGPGILPNLNPSGPRRIVGVVSPHAGYVYSGPVAAHSFAALAADGRPEVVILIGPNHQGMGAEVAIDSSSSWATPLGIVEVDVRLGDAIQSNSRKAKLDRASHVHEHSLEIQLPFLQYIYGDGIRIVPIIMNSQDLETSADLGRALAYAGSDLNMVIVASTDLTHYQRQEKAVETDQLVLESIIRMAPADLLKTVSKEHITMCGPGPVAAMLVAAQILGAVRARVLSYATSGDTSGDYSRIVGYGAAEVSRGARE